MRAKTADRMTSQVKEITHCARPHGLLEQHGCDAKTRISSAFVDSGSFESGGEKVCRVVTLLF